MSNAEDSELDPQIQVRPLSQNARVQPATPPPYPAPHTLNQIWCQAVTGARNLVTKTTTATTKCSADVALARCVIVCAFFKVFVCNLRSLCLCLLHSLSTMVNY